MIVTPHYLLSHKQQKSCRLYKNILTVREEPGLPCYDHHTWNKLQQFLFSSRAQNQTYATLFAKHVYCMYHLLFHGSGLPVGLTKSNTLIFQIWIALTQFLSHWGIFAAYSRRLQSSSLMHYVWQLLYHQTPTPTQNLTFSCDINSSIRHLKHAPHPL